MAVQGFRHKGLRELYETGGSPRLGGRYARNALLILDYVAGASAIRDLAGVKDFHELSGNRKGTYSMHVSGNYCITFRWIDGKAFDLDFEDYH